jgi:hypothetical protein
VLTFAVLALGHGATGAEKAVERLRDRHPADVPFDVADHVVWRNATGTLWFAGWSSAAPGANPHWRVDAHGITAASSRAWPRVSGWRRGQPWIEQLADRLRTTPGALEDLAGIFTLASLGDDGGVLATDPLGIGLLYEGRAGAALVLSNRSPMVADLLGASADLAVRRDPVGAGWLAYSAYPAGLSTGFEGVSLVPPGSGLRIDRDGRAHPVVPTTPAWRVDGPELRADVEGAMAVARQEIHTAIDEALADQDAPRMELTGGKDSRLVLAFLLESGRASSVDFQTYGEDGLPDVEIARQLCASHGLRHRTNPGRSEFWDWRLGIDERIRDRWGASLSEREITFRVTASTTAGMRNVSEPFLGRPASGPSTLSGLFGEVLRTNFPATAVYRTKSQVAGFPDHVRFGDAGILRPEWFDRYRSSVHGLLFEGIEATDAPQDAVDAFYIRQRLRRWFGPEYELNSTNRAFPLYSLTAIRLAFAIGAADRHREWLHHALLRGACPPLADVPFASGSWQADVAEPLRPVEAHDDPIPPPPAQRPPVTDSSEKVRTVLHELRASMRQTDVPMLGQLIDDADNPVFEVVDRAALAALVDRFDDATELQRDQAYGALTAGIWLGGYEIPLPKADDVIDLRTGAPAPDVAAAPAATPG